MSQQVEGVYNGSERIFRSLSEQLKVPFLQIRNMSEVAQLQSNQNGLVLQDIESISNASLRLLDAYLLAAQQEYGQTSLMLEPVSPSATLASVAYMLQPFALAHGVDIDVSIRGKYEPVMAHKKALEYAIFCIGHTLIDSIERQKNQARRTIILGTHKSRNGISIGVYVDGWQDNSSFSLSKARKLFGKVSQPAKELSPHAASGIFIADSLMASIGADTKKSRHLGSRGIGITLLASQQLSLI